MGLRQSTIVNRPKATLAKTARRGERFSGAAEKGVRKAMRGFRISRGSTFTSHFTEQNNEKEEEREGGGGSGNDWGKKMSGQSMVVGMYRRRRRRRRNRA